MIKKITILAATLTLYSASAFSDEHKMINTEMELEAKQLLEKHDKHYQETDKKHCDKHREHKELMDKKEEKSQHHSDQSHKMKEKKLNNFISEHLYH